MKPTITFNLSNYTSVPLSNEENIKVTASNTTEQSTISQGDGIPEYPWSPYYVTSDDFFDILRVAFDDTYGTNHRWHPEDLYVNVSCVLEVVSNTLANMVRIKAGKELHGVKEP